MERNWEDDIEGCDFDDGKRLVESMKKNPHWHHDIKFIDGEFVEDVVKKFQITHDEDLLLKIMSNYAIFKNEWAHAFSEYLDGDLTAGEVLYDHIIWKAAEGFRKEKTRKVFGKAFNALVVSCHLNQLKNFFNSKRAPKNSPQVKCPFCGDKVHQIDARHLDHRMDFERYVKTFPGFPLVSVDGTNAAVTAENLEMTNEMPDVSYRLVRDDMKLIMDKKVTPAISCPVTKTSVAEITANFPAMLAPNYTEEAFVQDFPEWPGLFACSKTGKKALRVGPVKQPKVDEAKGIDEAYRAAKKKVKNFADLRRIYPAVCFTTKQVPVMNPYTNEMVPELTPQMLASAGTTVKEHLEKYATIWIEKSYPKLIRCPFTGRSTNKIKRKDLEKLGKTVMEFYMAVCEYPLRKFLVRCAVDGAWVENIWDHLADVKHNYSSPVSIESFDSCYGSRATKAHVTTNSFVESNSGDVVHIADLFGGVQMDDTIELQDSLLGGCEDDIDRKIARSLAGCCTMDDVHHASAQKTKVRLTAKFTRGMGRSIRTHIQRELKHNDFELAETPKVGAKVVEVFVPSKKTIMSRLTKIIMNSDLQLPNSVVLALEKAEEAGGDV